MKATNNSKSPLKWKHAYQQPFYLAGFKWFEQDNVYYRLPVNPKHELPENPEFHMKNTSGGQIRFQTNSRNIAIRGKLRDASDMPHMPCTGQSGFDIYLGPPTKQRFMKVTKFPPESTEFEQNLLVFDDQQMRNITINFPLYNGVESVQIGLDEDANVIPPPPYSQDKPIIVYGTSITQGGCASRPGMSYTNILSRKLNIECVNLGFSAGGKGEPEVAEIIAEIPVQPSLFILDYEANSVSPDIFRETLPEFINILRKKYPAVPILIVSLFHRPCELISSEEAALSKERLAIQLDTVAKKNKEGDQNIFFISGHDILDENYDECTVDGTHPTDLGFYMMAKYLEKPINDILNVNEQKE